MTGGYSGLGLETVRALVSAGARVLVGARRPGHAQQVLEAAGIPSGLPAGAEGGAVSVGALDLADLASVKVFADGFLSAASGESGAGLDILINNAAIMASPEQRVGPGWESQFATNHLGHFALTNLLWDDTIYCSSLFGDYHEKIASADYADGQLLLMKGNPVTPDTALLVYRLSEGKRGAMSTLDGYHLSNLLRLIGRQKLLRLQVGPDWLSADGSFHEGEPPEFPIAQNRLTSSRYPFSVQAGFPKGEVWRYMSSEYPPLFSLLVFFGVVSGFIGHVIQKRSSSPTVEMQRALDAAEFVPYFQPVVDAPARPGRAPPRATPPR